MREEFLLPGDLITARGAAHVRTLLGSCVSICLSNLQRRLFAMTHFMLPNNPGHDDLGRYGDSSTKKVLGALFAMDADPRHYAARVYGGAAVVKGGQVNGPGIGERNIQLALSLLEQQGIRIVDQDVGGDSGRKVDFWTEDDRVECRRIIDQAPGAAPQVSTGRRQAGKLRVVVVDDSAVARVVLSKSISQAGMHVVGEADNAFRAREVVLETEPDVITLDLEMPRLDGLAFLRQLMKHFPLPVVVVSSSAPSGSDRARQALEAGAEAVVDKADLDMTGGGGNVEKVLIPRIRLAALSRHGRPK